MFQCPIPIINIPPTPPNHEWLKILVSAFAGLLVGIIIEPMKRVLEWENGMSRMLNAVLTDYRKIRLMVDNADDTTAKPMLDMPGFNYYWETRRDLFYETIELQILATLVSTLGYYQKLADAGGLEGKELYDAIKENIRQIDTLNLEPSSLRRLWRRINHKHRYIRGIRTSAWLKGESTVQHFGTRNEKDN